MINLLLAIQAQAETAKGDGFGVVPTLLLVIVALSNTLQTLQGRGRKARDSQVTMKLDHQCQSWLQEIRDGVRDLLRRGA